jgi:pyruvate dehydrogenase E1 component alpha subunit
MRGVQIDGNDVLGVRATVAEALEAARRGEGPCVIEALTYRLGDHTTADDAGRYRNAGDVQAAWKIEPLLRLRELLKRSRVWDDAREAALNAECAAEVDGAVREYLAGAKPRTDAMFDHLFATLPAHLHEQRDLARKYGTSSGGG